MMIPIDELHSELFNDPAAYYNRPGENGWPDGLSGYTERINRIRDATDARPITVNLRSISNIGPGNVADLLPVQVLRDAVDSSEIAANCFASNAETAQIISRKETRLQRINFYLGGSAGESVFTFTDELQSIILDMFPSGGGGLDGDWPNTRDNLLALATRDGSRSEELWGGPPNVTQADVDAAYQYGLGLEPVQSLLGR